MKNWTTASVLKLGSKCCNDRLEQLKRGRQIVFLVGSGISIWKPCVLPSGQAIVEALANRLVTNSLRNAPLLRGFVKKTAFEHIVEHCPRHDLLANLFSESFLIANANPVHESVARLLENGVAVAAITTNYDNGLEEAVRKFNYSSKPVVTESDLASVSTRSIFKIHGCVNQPDSLVFALRHEGELPKWKRSYLQQLVEGRDLLICGYSGMDFELCPELAVCRPRSLYWNMYRDPSEHFDEASPNAKRVLDTLGGTVLVGDMQEIWNKLDACPKLDLGSKDDPALIENLFKTLTSGEISIWRTSLLNGIGCPDAAFSSAVELNSLPNNGAPTQQSMRLGMLARSQFHLGKYRRAAINYRRAIKIVDKDRCFSYRALLDLKLAEIESWRCYGSLLFASWKLRKLRIAVGNSPADVKGKIARQKVLLIRPFYQIARTFRLNGLANRIRNDALENLKIAFRSEKESGNWHDLQMIEMWTNRFGISLSEVVEDNAFRPLRSLQGFKHLGYVVAVMMASRDELLTCEWSEKIEKRLVDLQEQAQAIGSNPELWKISLAILRRSNNRVQQHQSLNLFWRGFIECEYSICFRILLLLLDIEMPSKRF